MDRFDHRIAIKIRGAIICLLSAQLIIVDLKFYREAFGVKAVLLAEKARQVSGDAGVTISVAPKIIDMDYILRQVKIPFFAQHSRWFSTCCMISPVVKDLAHEYKDEVLFGKLDVDADSNPGVAREYCLMSISTLLVFKRGQVIDRVVGAIPKNVLEEKIRAQL